ncbi:hypothetical protein VNO80_30670 [Phaseolus coccineus]|uniref:Uncharacterized protein n=1 Tax=Phaseolus coccineus TaxID=3886 RepID=A0AAN9QG08_PHACN
MQTVARVSRIGRVPPDRGGDFDSHSGGGGRWFVQTWSTRGSLFVHREHSEGDYSLVDRNSCNGFSAEVNCGDEACISRRRMRRR